MINELISEVYKGIQKPVYEMTIFDRVELQQLLRKALSKNLQPSDREDFEFHANKFESDIYLIDSKRKEMILTQLATIQIAINDAKKALDVVKRGNRDDGAIQQSQTGTKRS